jgi:hypothetical protein
MFTLFRIITLAVGMLILFLSDVYPAEKFPRIGVLLLSEGGGAPMRAFHQGLKNLGYVEQKISFLSTDSQRENLNASRISLLS